MVETRTLVVDVDDTISTHRNRDYENAVPHTKIINKLNKMYESGWKIIYFTARGQVSCSGDLDLINQLRRPVLESWMEKHSVKYHSLMFGKPIGVYYIDDKAIRPEEFMDLDYEVLKGGSGGSVEKVGDRIIKKASNAKDQAHWYNSAGSLCHVPKVNTYYGDTLDMEFLDGVSLNDVCTKEHIDYLVDLLTRFSDIKVTNSNWQTMVDRVKDHMSLNAVRNESDIIKLLESDQVADFMNIEASFSHGDLTFENCIVRGEKVYLIDPNCPGNVYSSWVMDVGKIYQSLHSSYEESFSGFEAKVDKEDLFSHLLGLFKPNFSRYFLLCEMIHYIRMLKYKPENQKSLVRKRIQDIFKEVKIVFR
jgi:capsule biosynthesis phosphatase